MHFEPPLQRGRLLKRYKRFLADIELADGSVTTIHCPNTGSMKNCLFPGESVWFSSSDNPKRKYPYTWELMQTPSGDLIGINTGRANQLAEEAIRDGIIKELKGYKTLKREVRYGSENSRIDIMLTDGEQPDCYVEVKSATLLEGEHGFFPDAVTERGQKHLRELMSVVNQGQRGVLLFIVQHTGIHDVAAARHIDSAYAELLETALSVGVEVLAYCSELNYNEFKVTRKVPFLR
ncbi:XRE family transcriptional regulator [Shewanella mangrovi]|uniref:Sugar fermentation stimulation protein homolog n=1 Tax=Shewanella mangrovi TaxID=1515746 RepID=A0A094JDW2_9GAMM|nr:DNA/RNA nuclease SfsA [Shewanella mangrovi]KFZ37387.1 XRE family transcriptional regulator [Shewanella mangrovi]